MQIVNHDFDLHCHTTASDGSRSPAELLELAVSRGLTTLAITDHDTVEGMRSLMDASLDKALGIRLIAGTEFSCLWQGMTIHMLAFDFDLEGSEVAALLEKQKTRRLDRARVIADKLERKLKIADLYARAETFAESGVPARPHFAQALLEMEAVESIDVAFKKYLGAGKIGDVKLYWPDLEEVLTAVKRSKGYSSLAHPFKYKMTATKLRRLMAEIKACGGDAVEVSVPDINSGEFGWIQQEAGKLGLAQSAGSDYHGAMMPWRQLGRFPKMAQSLPSLIDVLRARQ
ncbi:PHP domain-containing protein [Hahella sp. HN01]|uniref:PHP domain-containing protein n=1 Tax=Hahella sp. HN01 TaxID=2847262 RepID=UPI001C1F1212|nr:PHP domain-containing protein [Hahella sp. HN01]MBU6954350.1 PHP domain-containing protein [Hahella sp. HN01]